MKINFFGLSCFLIENEKGFRVLVDPFVDTPEWTFGPAMPREFDGRPLGANLVLVSEPDADHAGVPRGLLQNAPPTTRESDPFPGLDLRGTVVYEWAGDVNIAWHYTFDGLRVAHFADNAHVLTDAQLKELGQPDIIFYPMPKADSEKTGVLDSVNRNIELLKPKLVICTHHIVPTDLPQTGNVEVLRTYFRTYFKKYAHTNAGYRGDESFIELSYVYENALALAQNHPSEILDEPFLTVVPEVLMQDSKKPSVIVFRSMLSGTFH